MRATRLQVAKHRRLLIASAALVALWITVRSASPAPDATVRVLVAARDLPAGHTLASGDLTTAVELSRGVPEELVTSALGRTLAIPIQAGDLVTDTRLLGPGLLSGQPAGTVAAGVRLSDQAVSSLVRPGDRVDVLASVPADWSAESDQLDGTDLTPPPAEEPNNSAKPSVPSSSPSSSPSTPSSSALSSSSTPSMPLPSGLSSGLSPAMPSSSTVRAGGAAHSQRSEAERVVSDALVLAVPGGSTAGSSGSDGDGSDSSGGLGGLGGLGGAGGGDGGSGTSATGTSGLIVLAVSVDTAARLAAAQNTSALSIVVLPSS